MSEYIVFKKTLFFDGKEFLLYINPEIELKESDKKFIDSDIYIDVIV